MKICTVCHEEKDESSFYKSGNKLRGECKLCTKNIRFKKSLNTKIKIHYKTCTCCNKTKPISEFNKNKNTSTGFSNLCKICSRLKCNEYAKNNKNKIKLKDKRYYYANKHKKYKQHKKWVLNNKDKVYKSQRIYYNKNKTKILAKCSIYNSMRKQYVIDKWNLWHLNNESKINLIYARKRNFGFNPLNEKFQNSNAHHLHLENNHDFIIYLPIWLHKLQFHNSNNNYGMLTINAIALDFWINEELYKNLYEL